MEGDLWDRPRKRPVLIHNARVIFFFPYAMRSETSAVLLNRVPSCWAGGRKKDFAADKWIGGIWLAACCRKASFL